MELRVGFTGLGLAALGRLCTRTCIPKHRLRETQEGMMEERAWEFDMGGMGGKGEGTVNKGRGPSKYAVACSAA